MENGLGFERPGFLNDFPSRMRIDERADPEIIRLVVGSEKNPGIRVRAFRHGIENRLLHQPVFVMATFWPRIGKQNVD